MRWYDKRLVGETRRDLVMAVCATSALVAAVFATVHAAIYFNQAGYSADALLGGSLCVGVAVYNALFWLAKQVVRPSSNW
jgi:hypothetical protein